MKLHRHDPARAVVGVCTRCAAVEGGSLLYRDRYDAWFCCVCDLWLEECCGNVACSLCCERPAHPSWLSREAHWQYALRGLEKLPTFTLTVCQTEAGARFWRERGGFIASLKREPGVAEPISAIAGDIITICNRELAQSKLHRELHGCEVDVKCAYCGCPCKYHTIGGPCFGSHVLRGMTELVGVEPPLFGERFCNCPGFVAKLAS